MKEVSFLNFYRQNQTDFLHYLFLVVAFLQKKNYQNNQKRYKYYGRNRSKYVFKEKRIQRREHKTNKRIGELK